MGAIAPRVISAAPAVVARPAIAVTRTAIPITQTTAVPITRTSVSRQVVGVSRRVVSTGIHGAAGIWKREAEAESDPQAWYGSTYGYSGLGGLGYGAGYGAGYATATIARPAYGYANLGYS